MLEKYKGLYDVVMAEGNILNDLILIKKLSDYEEKTKPFSDKNLTFFNTYPYFTLFELSLPTRKISDIRGVSALPIDGYVKNIYDFMKVHYDKTYKVEDTKAVVAHIKNLVDANGIEVSQKFLIKAVETNFRTLNENRLELKESGYHTDDFDNDIFGTVDYFYSLYKLD